MTWEGVYRTEAVAVYGVWVAPLLFLAWFLVSHGGVERAPLVPTHADFVRRYCLLFVIETMVDPWATGPLLRWMHWNEGPMASAVPLLFVLLGDFRVFWLVFTLARRDVNPWVAAARAVPWTLFTPITAAALQAGVVRVWPDAPGQTLWLGYEIVFCGLTLALATRVPDEAPPEVAGLRRLLRGLLIYAATYAALWATADVLILAGIDRGWGLRLIPNQLYYGLWIPLVYLGFFPRRRRVPPQAASV